MTPIATAQAKTCELVSPATAAILSRRATASSGKSAATSTP